MKKRQQIALCILCFLFASTLLASNEFIIESFRALPTDMAGSVYAKKDGNNEFCGLIKVKTGIKEDLDFSSSLKFNLFEKKKPGEYWVYVSPGEGRLTLYAEGFTPKHFHITSEKIESKRSYELVVRAKEEQKIPIVIFTDPPDAEKWLDGELLGTGDNFQVVPGKYRLSIKKEGYKEYSAEVLFDKDNALIKDIELKQIQPVEVHITSSPLGTDIYIDNTLIGKTNKGTYLYPGTYSLRLSQSGYVDINEKIVIKETARNTFNYNLVKNTGIMQLKISPPDAKILINKTEHTGKKEVELAPGKYLLEVSKPGYYEDSKVIELKRGETADIVLSLIQKTGNFQLSIGPFEAACRLMQGEEVIQSWTGMKRINDLPVGDYEVLCTADKYKPGKWTFSVVENKSTVLDIQMQELSFENIVNELEQKYYELSCEEYQEYGRKIIAENLSAIQKAVKKNDSEAQYLMGVRYYIGAGVEEDTVEAVKWFRKAAKQGYARAQYNLGECYYCGEGVLEDEAEAARWWRKAAEQENADAQYALGDCYYYGEGVSKDTTEAIKWWRKAAEQGHIEAQYDLGNNYYIGRGVAEDKAEAVKWYRKAAEQGDVFAQYDLGLCYFNGKGVHRDYEEAAKWFFKAAEQGNEKAQLKLGDYYYYGIEVAEDKAEALKWYRKAAAQGSILAYFGICATYRPDEEVPVDEAEAIKWYRKAAEQGNAEAQYFLGYHHLYEDNLEAVKWLRKSAEQGYPDAQYQLGNCYYYGIGVAEDKEEAIKWWRKSAEQGHPSVGEYRRR